MSGMNSRPFSIHPALSKLLERLVFSEILNDFSVNGLDSEFQHACKDGHSTCTALTQMADVWLSQIDGKKLLVLSCLTSVLLSM